MASSTGTYCDICQKKHISKAAEEYCPECEEAFCTDCKDHHKLAKASKSHQAILIDEYNNLPPFIREIKQQCDEHGDIFDFFCPTHNELCCKRCITTTHKECNECIVIEDFVKFSKSSTTIDEYEKTLKDVEGNIQTAIDDRKYNLEQFEKQTQDITKQVKGKRNEINEHFDDLEARKLEELSTIGNEKKQNIQSVIENLEKHKNNNKQLREDVDAMKKYGSNKQAFMGTIKLQQLVSSQEKFVRSLQDDESLRFVELECSISEGLNSISTGNHTFGTVTQISSDTLAQFNWKSTKLAQILTPPTGMNSIGNINPKLICKIDVDTDRTITSCVLGRYLLFSTMGNVLQYNSKGKYLKKVELTNSHAFDIVLIDLNTIAVTGGSSSFKIYILDVGTLELKRDIDVGEGNWLFGATYEKESIIGCTKDNAINSFNIAIGKDISQFALPLNIKHTANAYLASDNNHIYFSDLQNNSVTCYERKGKIIWSFNKDILKEPRSICLDSNSNVYVAGSGSDNVVVFSSDGLHSKQLLGPDDGIQKPHAIHYDKSSKRLLVVNEKGPAFLYQTV
ncbi:uncharacterized protein [Mytilus edulis]|uniref:uncharacterized protein n=1 Tax=Mytilus edulis TaxID=6550 RepID=UPI0039EF68DC